MSLFDLTGEALRLSRRIEDAASGLFSDDPAAADQARAELEGLITAEAQNRQALDAKADAWCWVIDGIRARAAAQSEHANRLAALAKDANQQADAMQDRLVAALAKVDGTATTWKLPSHTLSSRRSVAVELDPDINPEDLPSWCKRTKIEADKTAIREHLTAGHRVNFAQLVERRTWKIK